MSEPLPLQRVYTTMIRVHNVHAAPDWADLPFDPHRNPLFTDRKTGKVSGLIYTPDGGSLVVPKAAPSPGGFPAQSLGPPA